MASGCWEPAWEHALPDNSSSRRRSTTRLPSIRLNPAKCKSLALEDIRTNDLRMLGTCVGSCSAREQFLQEKIDHEAATIAKLINLPHQHALLVLRV
jgi:hypothetical protein